MSRVSGAVALLRTGFAAWPDVKVYLGRVTDATTPNRFVIVTDAPGTRSRETYGGAADVRAGGVRLTIAATMPNGSDGDLSGRAEWLADKCESILTGVRPFADTSTFEHELTRYMGNDEALTALQSAYYVADFALVTP